MSIGTEKEVEYILDRPGEIHVSNNGNIYISDWGSYNIRCFDRDGQYLSTFGREGQGPGEFLSLRFAIGSNGNIYTLDSGNSRISIINIGGKQTNTLKMLNLNTGHHRIFTDFDNNFYFSREFRDEKGYSMSIYKYNSIGEEVFDYGRFKGDQFIWRERYGEMRPMRTSSTPTTVWIASKSGRLYTSFNEKYQIRVYESNGKLSLQCERDYVLQPDSKNWLGGTYDFLPAFSRKWLLDDSENLWIELFRMSNEDSYIYDVFSRNGVYLKQVHIDFRIFTIRNEKIYCIVTSENWIPVLKRYKIKNWDKIKDGIQ